MYKKCEYLDPNGFMKCNTDINDCSKCPIKREYTMKNLFKWFFYVTGIICMFCVILGLIFL